VLSAVQQLARDGMTMVVVTHEMTFARDVGSRIVFMDAAKVVVDGSPHDVLVDPRHERLRSFLARIEMKHH
jgi:polar amino acid transport system ATP-binding protein